MLPFSGDTKTTIFLSPSDSHTKQAAGKNLSCQQFLKLVYTAIVVSSLSITYLHNVKGLGSNRTNTSYRKAQEILHSVIYMRQAAGFEIPPIVPATQSPT